MILLIRVPYYFGDPKRDPNSYPYIRLNPLKPTSLGEALANLNSKLASCMHHRLKHTEDFYHLRSSSSQPSGAVDVSVMVLEDCLRRAHVLRG